MIDQKNGSSFLVEGTYFAVGKEQSDALDAYLKKPSFSSS